MFEYVFFFCSFEELFIRTGKNICIVSYAFAEPLTIFNLRSQLKKMKEINRIESVARKTSTIVKSIFRRLPILA